jgi:hypothetical protein
MVADPATTQIIIAVIGSGAIFSFIQFLIQRRDNKSSKIDELCKKIDEDIKTQSEESKQRYSILQRKIKEGLDERENTGKERFLQHQEAIQKLNEVIFQLTKNDTEQNQRLKYIGDELMGLAHDKLVNLTDHYQARGAITLKERATLEAIYKPYHEGLGGNGDGEQGYKYAIQLPVVTDSKAAEMDKELNIR